jgi:hypothetical protein
MRQRHHHASIHFLTHFGDLALQNERKVTKTLRQVNVGGHACMTFCSICFADLIAFLTKLELHMLDLLRCGMDWIEVAFVIWALLVKPHGLHLGE